MSAPKKVNSTLLVPVFIPSIIVITLLVAGTVANPKLAGDAFSSTLAFITNDFGWFYMLAVALFLIFIVTVAISPWGKIKLGPDHSEPEYSFSAWFAMLFSAGYGIALLFFGVAEPVLHYADPPVGDPRTIEAARQSMQITFFHWGFHIWAIYGLVGLVLAYFGFRHGLPLSMRSALYPLVGDRIYGPIGHTVDVFAVLGTMFGIATTLGLSVAQLNAGLNYLWPSVPVNIAVQIISIALITSLATLSVVAGMDAGIKRLSQLNMLLAITLMLFVFAVGPTVFILKTFMQNTGSYLSNIVERSFSLQAYSGGNWIGNWTLFIFGWTIAWAPFVGLFIAKISRGRTIRQFVLGVMVVPTLFTFFWFSVFGDTALHAIMVDGYTHLIDQVEQNKAIALFKLFEHLPFASITSFLAIILIVTFFVTSADSGALVVDSLASGGAMRTPVWQRIFWASSQGVSAAVLLLAGGLSALQTASITSALPFAIIMLIAAIGLWRALQIEGYRETSLRHHMNSGRHNRLGDSKHWQKRLHNLVDFPSKENVTRYIETTVADALKTVEAALKKEEWPVKLTQNKALCRYKLSVISGDDMAFEYEVRLRGFAKPSFAFPAISRDNDGDDQYYRAEVFMRRGGLAYDVYGYEKDQLISDVLDHFEKYMHFLHTTPAILPWKVVDDEAGEAPGAK
ncbi:MAG: choline transporter [Halothiobacillus sp. 14-56-357]|jgi:choline/glycine/proline betaine transport protein|nr:MAG: choline transporter [Halothiobacillus sp. 15-55-196]OZB57389.1 MAG: choline transporter [Halothiobacillus sp. 14-56-357]OZB79488.1 MAG: choline transporter [Halothiobacillus sp. 13-55-115]